MDIRTVRTHKVICDNCSGNGFVYIIPYSEVKQCPQCKSEGELVIQEPSKEEMDSILNPSW